MYRLVLISLVITLIIFGCGQDKTQLEKDTPAYNFAKKISEKVPYFDPDQNNVVVTTRDFNTTSGELLGIIYKTAGQRTTQFYNLDTTVLKGILSNNAKQFVEKKLLLQAIKKDGFKISDSKMDSLMEQQYLRHGGRDKLMESVQKIDVDVQTVDQQMKESVIIENYLNQKLLAKTQLNDEQLKEAYMDDKTATVRHILLNTQGKSDSEKEEIRQKMEGLLERARSGEDFAALAKEYSEDRGSKDNGGLYKDFARGAMVKPFEDAAFSLEVGALSEPVQTQFGYHVILRTA